MRSKSRWLSVTRTIPASRHERVLGSIPSRRINDLVFLQEARFPNKVAKIPVRKRLLATAFWALWSGSLNRGAVSIAQTPAGRAELLFVGDYYPGQVRAVTGDTMLGLFRLPGGWALAATRLTVDSIHNACMDQPGERNGRRVRIDRSETPLFLIRGVPRLRPGPVRTVSSERDQVFPGQTREFQFKPRVDHWVISAFGRVPYAQPGRALQGGIRDYLLVVSRNPWDRSQTIFEVHATPGAGGLYSPPTVVWIGDLDGDGQMDLLLDTKTGELPGSWVLYLSSLATGAELIHKVAEYHDLTC